MSILHDNDVLSRIARLWDRVRQNSKSHTEEDLGFLTAELDSLLSGLGSELESLKRAQKDLDRRLRQVEESVIFRTLKSAGQLDKRFRGWLHSLISRNPADIPPGKIDPPQSGEYGRWLAGKTAKMRSPVWYLDHIRAWHYQPHVQVVIILANPRREWLLRAIGSVLAQTYTNWRLNIYCGQTKPWAMSILEEQCRSSRRVHCEFQSGPVDLAEALNRTLESPFDYVAFLAENDFLTPHALYHACDALQDNRAGVLYADETYVDEKGRPLHPLFKPDWSPKLPRSPSYPGRFLVVSRKRMEDVAGAGFLSLAGADPENLAGPFSDGASSVIHIPEILYYRRSPARAPRVEMIPSAKGEMRCQEQPGGLVSIVICSRTAALLASCLKAIRQKTDYVLVEIVVVHHEDGSDSSQDRAMREVIERWGCRRVPYAGPFNFSKMNNLGVRAASGEFIVFLNDDVRPLNRAWLAKLVAPLRNPEVGATGAMLLYPSGAIQHAGIVVGMADGAGHPGRNSFGSAYWEWLTHTRNVSAVTGACLGVRRAVYDEMGGFDASFAVNYNDVDLCLRLRRASYEVIFVRNAVLCHAECQTRQPGTNYEERQRFFQRWSAWIDRGDPYYSPHLRRDVERVCLEF